VYHGEHIFTGREVAIKIVHSPRGMTHEMLERGKAEARALGKLDHPNIVVMHDAGVTDDGLFYIVMELLRGRSLRSALSVHGHFTIEEVLNLAISVADAVQAAHEIGLIHRDLTPDNVYLTRNNRVKVLDFGIAKMLNEIGFTTHKDIVMGSILYMSPEQVQGLQLTPRSDVCALGLMMFEMLLGNHPSLLIFERDLRERNEPPRRAALADIPPIQAHRAPPLLSDVDPNIPLDLAQVVSRAISKNPDDRFSTMRELSSALRACQEAYSGEAPITVRRGGNRDLSQRVEGESLEPPSSQRVTPRRGLIWDGEGSLTPVPLPSEGDPTTAGGGSDGMRGDGFVTRRSPRHGRSVASLKNALMALCICAIALGTLGALRYFEASQRGDARAPAEIAPPMLASTATNSISATLSPTLAVTPQESVVEPLSPSEQPEQQSANAPESPNLRATSLSANAGTRTPAAAARPTRGALITTTASARLGDPMADVSRPLAIEPFNKHPQETTSKEPRKRLNGGKLIYGD